jgi:hypothetical protein
MPDNELWIIERNVGDTDQVRVCVEPHSALQTIALISSSRTGATCTMPSGDGTGEIRLVNPDLLPRLRSRATRVLDTSGEQSVDAGGLVVSGAEVDRAATTTRRRQTTVAETVTKGIEDAYTGVTGFFTDKINQQPTSVQRPEPEAPEGEISPPDLPVSQASIMPGGPWPWVIGGSLLLVIGGTAFANWYRGRK